MNIERMRKLASVVERHGLPYVDFNMESFCSTSGYVHTLDWYKYSAETHSCQTAACNAGYACIMFGQDGDLISGGIARHLLDLTEHQADQLFYNEGHYIANKMLHDITRTESAAAIRRMIAEEEMLHATE